MGFCAPPCPPHPFTAQRASFHRLTRSLVISTSCVGLPPAVQHCHHCREHLRGRSKSSNACHARIHSPPERRQVASAQRSAMLSSNIKHWPMKQSQQWPRTTSPSIFVFPFEAFQKRRANSNSLPRTAAATVGAEEPPPTDRKTERSNSTSAPGPLDPNVQADARIRPHLWREALAGVRFKSVLVPLMFNPFRRISFAPAPKPRNYIIQSE